MIWMVRQRRMRAWGALLPSHGLQQAISFRQDGTCSLQVGVLTRWQQGQQVVHLGSPCKRRNV